MTNEQIDRGIKRCRDMYMEGLRSRVDFIVEVLCAMKEPEEKKVDTVNVSRDEFNFLKACEKNEEYYKGRYFEMIFKNGELCQKARVIIKVHEKYKDFNRDRPIQVNHAIANHYFDMVDAIDKYCEDK